MLVSWMKIKRERRLSQRGEGNHTGYTVRVESQYGVSHSLSISG
jgi:hypothetical protein